MRHICETVVDEKMRSAGEESYKSFKQLRMARLVLLIVWITGMWPIANMCARCRVRAERTLCLPTTHPAARGDEIDYDDVICDNSKCSSNGNDCCAPDGENASCYNDYYPVRANSWEDGCWAKDNGLYTCCSSGDVTADNLDDIYDGFDWEGDETTNKCREWGYPVEGVWNVDDDCCAGEKQAACETGYRYVNTKNSCYEECAYYYSCDECTDESDESCDSNYDIYKEDGKDYDCDDFSIIGLIIGIIIPCFFCFCAVRVGVYLKNRQNQARRNAPSSQTQQSIAAPGVQTGTIAAPGVQMGTVVGSQPVQGVVFGQQPPVQGSVVQGVVVSQAGPIKSH